MRKRFGKLVITMLLTSSMIIGSTSFLTACGSSKKNEIVTLDVYSQLANYSGIQTGWIADLLKEKFKVKLNIIPNGDGVFETRMEDGNLGDIIVWGNDSDNYPQAVKSGLLYDWNEDDLLAEEGPYIQEHMEVALKKNRELTSVITDGASDSLYGFGHNVATSAEDHESFFYTWDIRWDLYKALEYPEVNTLEDYANLLKDMCKLCPKDDNGNKTYAVSLWPDWDDSMVMYVKATATAWYGYDELGIGLYDPKTGKYHDALEENGPYLEMLKFYNTLYQDGLLDPDSMSQTYDKMIEKVQNGGTMFSIFNYSGSIGYNKKEHTDAGKIMYCMKPGDATPIVYGMNPQGGEQLWTIGASTEYPELCMEIINWLSTPEGRLTVDYGPKGVCWDYDKDGNTYFTDLGKNCNVNKNTKMGGKYKGTFQDGTLQITNTTWSIDAANPDSNGETYNSDNWKSNLQAAKSEIEQDWREYNGVTSINEYFEKQGKYVLSPGTSFTKSEKSDELKTTWAQVTSELISASWRAIYAKNDSDFDKIVSDMIKKCDQYGYNECVAWSANEAARRKSLEDAVSQR